MAGARGGPPRPAEAAAALLGPGHWLALVREVRRPPPRAGPRPPGTKKGARTFFSRFGLCGGRGGRG